MQLSEVKTILRRTALLLERFKILFVPCRISLNKKPAELTSLSLESKVWVSSVAYVKPWMVPTR